MMNNKKIGNSNSVSTNSLLESKIRRIVRRMLNEDSVIEYPDFKRDFLKKYGKKYEQLIDKFNSIKSDLNLDKIDSISDKLYDKYNELLVSHVLDNLYENDDLDSINIIQLMYSLSKKEKIETNSILNIINDVIKYLK